MVTQQRREEMRSVVQTVGEWAAKQNDVRGVVVVGSWARNAARMDSDVDIVVLTDTSAHADPGLWTQLLDGHVIRLQQWGPLREIRLRRSSGFEVELGVVPLSWADTDPVDPGTNQVINDGIRPGRRTRGLVCRVSVAGERPVWAPAEASPGLDLSYPPRALSRR